VRYSVRMRRRALVPPSRETRLDQYIVAMYGFLAVNLVHSVLSSPPR